MTHYLPSVISCSNTLLPLLLPRATPSAMHWIPLCSLLLSSISYYPHLILKKNTTTKLNLPWFSSPITALSHLHNQKPETFILIYIHLNFFSLLQRFSAGAWPCWLLQPQQAHSGAAFALCISTADLFLRSSSVLHLSLPEFLCTRTLCLDISSALQINAYSLFRLGYILHS